MHAFLLFMLIELDELSLSLLKSPHCKIEQQKRAFEHVPYFFCEFVVKLDFLVGTVVTDEW